MAQELATKLRGVNVYLVGMMGAGKTTVGRWLAGELGYRFMDTDQSIERVAGQKISEIFAQAGEERFRQLESQVLAEICAYKNLSVATGGGIVLRPENWGYLHHGIVVWLDVPAPQLYTRLRDDTARPLLQTGDPLTTLQGIADQRQKFYAQADVRVEAGAAPDVVGRRVIEEIGKVLRPG